MVIRRNPAADSHTLKSTTAHHGAATAIRPSRGQAQRLRTHLSSDNAPTAASVQYVYASDDPSLVKTAVTAVTDMTDMTDTQLAEIRFLF